MKETHQHIISQIEYLDRNINEIDNELNKNREPRKPIQPKEPYISKNQKPDFFSLAEFVLSFLIVSIPLYFIAYILIEVDSILYVLIISAVLALMHLNRLYQKELKKYNKYETENSKKLKKYEDEKLEYKKQIATYNNEYKKYLEIENENQNLINKRDEIQIQIAKLFQEIDSQSDWSMHELIMLDLKFVKYESLRKRKKRSEEFSFNDNDLKDINQSENVNKASNYLSNLSLKRKEKIIDLLKEVEKIQKSNLS